jgi:uncharacterized protein YdaU (DUF1376 family)
VAKDPAFLFYPGDWLSGTLGMSFEEKGAYMELLMMQFSRGHMTKDMIGQIVGQLWVKLQDKFIQDDAGLWYNKRLDEEKEKRKNFVASRLNNKNGTNQHSKKEGHLTSDMEDENVNKDKYIKEKEIFEKSRKLYPGTKNGSDTEFNNFKKKHTDWKEALIIIEKAIANQVAAKALKKSKGEFAPEWKNFSTWINKRCWEEEIGDGIQTQEKKVVYTPKVFDRSKYE